MVWEKIAEELAALKTMPMTELKVPNSDLDMPKKNYI